MWVQDVRALGLVEGDAVEYVYAFGTEIAPYDIVRVGYFVGFLHGDSDIVIFRVRNDSKGKNFSRTQVSVSLIKSITKLVKVLV